MWIINPLSAKCSARLSSLCFHQLPDMSETLTNVQRHAQSVSEHDANLHEKTQKLRFSPIMSEYEQTESEQHIAALAYCLMRRDELGNREHSDLGRSLIYQRIEEQIVRLRHRDENSI